MEQASPWKDAWLRMMFAGRFCSALIVMVYAACVPRLLDVWEMSATEAGTVQAAFGLANAFSLMGVSWLSDHFGARRVLLVSTWVGAAISLAFAVFARSFEQALVLYTLVGLTVGGNYIPAVLLASDRFPPAREYRESCEVSGNVAPLRAAPVRARSPRL